MATDIHAVDLRQRVINDLCPELRPVAQAIERAKRAYQAGHLKPSHVEAIFAAGDGWLDPIVARAEEGEL